MLPENSETFSGADGLARRTSSHRESKRLKDLLETAPSPSLPLQFSLRPRPTPAQVQQALHALDPTFARDLELASRSSRFLNGAATSLTAPAAEPEPRLRDRFKTTEVLEDDQYPTSSSRGLQARNAVRYRSVVEQDVRKAEKALLSALPRCDLAIPDHRQTALAHVNHVLYLAARVPSTRLFNRVSHILEDLGLVGDSYTHLARLVLLDRTNQLHKVPNAWNEYARHRLARRDASGGLRGIRSGGGGGPFSSSRDAVSTTIVLNTVLWMYAKRARWDVVQPVYARLLRNLARSEGCDSSRSAWAATAESPSASSASLDTLVIPKGVLPDRITYTSLIRGLAWHGRFHPAISVLQDMVADPHGYAPDPSVFISLFQGFGRFGEIGSRREDDASNAQHLGGESWLSTISPGVSIDPEPTPRIFPEPFWPSDTDITSGHPKPGVNFFTKRSPHRPDDMSTFRRLTDLWSHTAPIATSQTSPWQVRSGDENDVADENPWTLTALDQLFIAFLALRPGHRSQPSESATPPIADEDDVDDSLTRAPTPRAVYYILVAFARVTGEDREVLRTVWADLEAKFGPQGQEGWRGWKVDKRLERLVQQLEDEG